MNTEDDRPDSLPEYGPKGVYEVDAHLKVIRFDEAFCKVIGHSAEAVSSRNLTNFIDKQYKRMAYQAFVKAYVNNRGFTELIWVFLDAEGNNRIVESSAGLITDEKGKRIGFRAIARDVSGTYAATDVLPEARKRDQRQRVANRPKEKLFGSLLNFVPYPMVVLNVEGKVIFLNPAFTRDFGWTLEDLLGRRIPYVPDGLKDEMIETHKKLFDRKILARFETKRLTKDGRILDVIMKRAVYTRGGDEAAGELIILRDITSEKRMNRIRETLHGISMALPKYPNLEDLLDYISREIKNLLNTEGALVILHDEETRELYSIGAAYDNRTTQKRVKEIRFPDTEGIAARVIRTGESAIAANTSRDPSFSPNIDRKLGYRSRNRMDVPLKSGERIIGVLSASNKKDSAFDQNDLELLVLIAGTVALSVENAQVTRELKAAYREVQSLNRAKDRTINHLSHELKTPISILLASLNILERNALSSCMTNWKPTLERAKRNLDRLLDIQNEAQDIMLERSYQSQGFLNIMLDQCADDLETRFAEELGEGKVVERVREYIDAFYGPKTASPTRIALDAFVRERLESLKPQFRHRAVTIIPRTEQVPDIGIPEDVLQKVVDGLIRNAVENTPDDGKIEIRVEAKGKGCQVVVADCGIGITEDSQSRILEGFFPARDTMHYSSMKPFDFGAGGKGADLLRMKVFAERFNFKISLESSRCSFIPKEEERCPGRIRDCIFCNKEADCFGSGGTTVTVFFPAVEDADNMTPAEPGALQGVGGP